MTSTIILNATNVVANSNNTKYIYRFDKAQSFKGAEVALSSIQLYYSWFNLDNELYNNTTFQYVWFNSSGVLNQTFTVVIPNGFYTIETLNLFFQSVLLQNGHFIVDTSTKNNIFFFELIENSTYYAIQMNVLPVPSTLATNQQKGSSSWGLPTTGTTPQIIILNSNNFKNLIGFNNGTYPATSSNLQQKFLSNFTPAISPVSSVSVRCNLAKNILSNPSDILFCFSQGMAAFGDLISVAPNNLNWTQIQDGNYTQLEIVLNDQNFQPMKIKDNQLIIVILIKQSV